MVFSKIELIEVQFKNKYQIHHFSNAHSIYCLFNFDLDACATSLQKKANKPFFSLYIWILLYVLKSIEIKAGILCDGLFRSLGTLVNWVKENQLRKKRNELNSANLTVISSWNVMLFHCCSVFFSNKNSYRLKWFIVHYNVQLSLIFFCCFAGIVIAIVVVAAADTKIIVLAADVVLHCYYIYSLLPLHEIPRLRHTKRQREREMYYILSGWFRCDTFHRCITSLMNFNRNCSCSTCFLSATE